MQAAGIICEYNPFHRGHERHIRLTKEAAGLPVICVMSGSFVQRGGPAVLWKFARAHMAVRCGADLVLELPVSFACAGAQRFALGGVGLLAAAGIVTCLSFGSESGSGEALADAARLLEDEAAEAALRRHLKDGMSYAAARQRAMAEIDPAAASLLSSPNDILAVEYLRAIRTLGAEITPLPIRREGAGHDGGAADGSASASHIRGLLLSGQTEEAMRYMPDAARSVLPAELDAGRGPADPAALDTAVMSILRRMDAADFARLPDISEGLEYRLARAARTAASPAEFCGLVKTKRYPLARLRRIVTAAYLGLTAADMPERPACARVLALNDTGRALLREIREIPTVSKAADGAALGGDAARQLALEARADDLWALALPAPAARRGGLGWTASPVYVPDEA